MRLNVKHMTILAGISLISACATTPPDIQVSRLDEARALIAKAKQAGAEQCAPERQAEAVAKLYEAAHELSEGNIHPDEQASLIDESIKAAKQAYAKSKSGCKPEVIKPEVIELRGVYFKTDSAELTPASTATLDHAVDVLNRRSDIRVEVAAHTDSRGTDAYNMELSMRRAGRVKDYLIAHGVAASRLTLKGYGETRPVADNSTPAGRAKNRRVELHVR